ncbi:MAG: radical SAM protein [Candidatus Komeilibacteria bacterium]
MSGTVPISHGSGQMRAQSISIQVSNRTRCNAGCKFCISRTTPGVADACSARDIQLCDEARLRVGLGYAQQLGASHAILTSRAETTQENPDYLKRLVSICRGYLPLVDMHTNGFLLHGVPPKGTLLKELTESGLTMITFSIASFNSRENQKLMNLPFSAADLIGRARDLGLLVRCSLVVNHQGVRDFDSIIDYINVAGELGAHMVVIREVWRPDVYGDFNREVLQWNRDNWIDIGPIQDQFLAEAAKNNGLGLKQRDPLPWGTPVLVMGGVFEDPDHGVNITFARCDEATAGSVLKSIVHKPNGHGYRNWDHNGDILY